MTRILERLNSKAGQAVRKTASKSVASLSRVVVGERSSRMLTVKTQHGQQHPEKSKGQHR
jgi:hypothetical protein